MYDSVQGSVVTACIHLQNWVCRKLKLRDLSYIDYAMRLSLRKWLCTSHFHRVMQNELFVFSSTLSHSSWYFRSQMSWALILDVQHEVLNSAQRISHKMISSIFILHLSVLLQRESIFSCVGDMHQSYDVVSWLVTAALHVYCWYNLLCVNMSEKLSLQQTFASKASTPRFVAVQDTCCQRVLAHKLSGHPTCCSSGISHADLTYTLRAIPWVRESGELSWAFRIDKLL